MPGDRSLAISGCEIWPSELQKCGDRRYHLQHRVRLEFRCVVCSDYPWIRLASVLGIESIIMHTTAFNGSSDEYPRKPENAVHRTDCAQIDKSKIGTGCPENASDSFPQLVGNLATRFLPQAVGDFDGTTVPQPVGEIRWGHNAVLIEQLNELDTRR